MNVPTPLPLQVPDLRRLGMLPHPHISQSGYDWCGGTPFDPVQTKTVELLTENPRAFVLNSQGTGKTKAALWAFDYLQRLRVVKRMLVIAPLSTLNFTWAREIIGTCSRLQYRVLHGTRDKRLKMLAEPADVYIINHDGLTLLEKEIIARDDIDVLCFDEVAFYRNRNKRTRVAETVARAKPVVWGMTGSPTPNAPTDVFHQAKIVNPHTVPKYYGTFREMVMLKVNQFKWVPKRGSHETALAALQPSVRYTLDDITELPSFISRRQDVGLSAKQQKIYHEIRKDAYAMVQSGEIKASNAAGVMSKLQQISLGWVYLSGGKVAELDASRRVEALIDVVNSCERKVIVFVPFKHAMYGLAGALTADSISNLVVSGDTPLGERSRSFTAFQNGADPKVLVAHPQCLAHGITLTAADTVVWFAPITSSEVYAQANARIRRVGQQHKQLFLHMQATPVERHIYDLLINKIDGQDNLLKLLEEACKE